MHFSFNSWENYYQSTLNAQPCSQECYGIHSVFADYYQVSLLLTCCSCLYLIKPLYFFPPSTNCTPHSHTAQLMCPPHYFISSQSFHYTTSFPFFHLTTVVNSHVLSHLDLGLFSILTCTPQPQK